VARKAAQALAAYEGTPQVGVDEVKQVADMVLAHRVKGAGQRDFADLGRTLTNLARVSPS
jgi:Mg-chelatase subunit ChlI